MRTVDNLLEQKKDDISHMIHKEFEKSEADIDQCVEILQRWVKMQPHLPETPSYGQIIQFLNFNKYSIEKAKQRIDMYYSVRALIPDMFEGFNPNNPIMKQQSKLTYYLPLPKLAPNYNRVVYCKINDNGPVSEFSLERYLAVGFNAFEVLMQEDISMGFLYIFECTHFKAAHMPKMNLMTIKKTAFIMEKVFSNRISGIHIINAPNYIDLLVSLLKSVLTEKLGERIYVHKTLDSLFNIIPKEILPEDIGGNELPLAKINDLWQEKFLSYKERFDKLDTLRVNERLRPAPLINDEILGFYGNFKKLSVD